MKTYPYRLHVALTATASMASKEWPALPVLRRDGGYAYKIRYFDGVAAGTPSRVNLSGTVGFLGNASQQLLSMTRACSRRSIASRRCDSRRTIRRSAAAPSRLARRHAVHHRDRRLVSSVRSEQSGEGRTSGPHLVKLPHAMKRTASGRFICYGLYGQPARRRSARSGSGDRDRRGCAGSSFPRNVLVRAIHARHLLSRVVPCPALRGVRLSRVGDGVLQGVRLRDRRGVRRGAAPMDVEPRTPAHINLTSMSDRD